MLESAVMDIVLPYSGGDVHTTMLAPHRIFASIYNEDERLFWHVFMSGDVGNVPKFWKSMKHHQAVKDHAEYETRKFQTGMIPLDLHMDGVPVIATARKHAQSAVIYSTRHVTIYVVVSEQMCKVHTYEPITHSYICAYTRMMYV
jgi:hypothetical protein